MNETKEDLSATIGELGDDAKPGQKYPTPSPGNGDRVFYETLLAQRPDSEMAQDFVLAYGILDLEEAQKLNIKVAKRKGKPAPSPMKKPASQSSSSSSSSKVVKVETKKEPTARKRKTTIEGDGVEDTGMETGTMWEGSGTGGI